MRVPEKTIELNFCAELTSLWAQQGHGVLWFGPTQKQEARLGFDAATRLGGKVLLFQFKASRHVLRSGERRFHAPHQQMLDLQHLCQNQSRSVFYVFPTFGTTAELLKSPSVLNNTILMDVASLPAIIPPPTKRDGTMRAAGAHLVDVDQNTRVATIHSDPFKVPLMVLSSMIDQPQEREREQGPEREPEHKQGRDQDRPQDAEIRPSDRVALPSALSKMKDHFGWKLQAAVVYPKKSP